MTTSIVAIENILALSDSIRYAAIYREGHLTSMQRPDVQNASSEDSDRYEELLVNPTILTILRQRGEIDCGGMQCVVIHYGRFKQLVIPLQGGHVSISFEACVDPGLYVKRVETLIAALLTEMTALHAISETNA